MSQPPAPQQQQPRHERINNEPASPKSVVHLADEVCQRSRINSESGRDTPAGSVSTHASNTARTHYYLDDRDMPPWKIYAKELLVVDRQSEHRRSNESSHGVAIFSQFSVRRPGTLALGQPEG